MPIYSISHTTPLSDTQRDSLAEAITKIHTELFTTPSLFVNVRFAPTSQYVGYVGGKRAEPNVIQASVRHGPSRTPEMFEKLLGQLYDTWGKIVPSDPDVRIFVSGDLIAGFEHGVSLPPAGGDQAWLKKNLPFFEKKAKEGNQEMVELVQEIKDRKLIEGMSNGA